MNTEWINNALFMFSYYQQFLLYLEFEFGEFIVDKVILFVYFLLFYMRIS